MKTIVQFKIYKGENKYVGESIDLPIVTQGDTVDEVAKNIKEAVSLHLEGEDLFEMGLSPHPAVLVNLDLDLAHA